MSIQRHFISFELSINTGEKILTRKTREYPMGYGIEFYAKIAQDLQNIYPYIDKRAYFHIISRGIEEAKETITENLSEFYAYIGDGIPLEIYTPKSLGVKFIYRDESVMVDRNAPTRLSTMTEAEIQEYMQSKIDIGKVDIGLSFPQQTKSPSAKFGDFLLNGLLFLIGIAILCILGCACVVIAGIFNKDFDDSFYISLYILLISFIASVLSFLSFKYWKKIVFLFKYSIFSRLFLATTLLFLVALADCEYWYYTLLKVASCAVFVYSAVKFRLEWAKWIFGILAVLYNPILPVHLNDKEVWTAVNIATALFMWTALYFENKNNKTEIASQ